LAAPKIDIFEERGALDKRQCAAAKSCSESHRVQKLLIVATRELLQKAREIRVDGAVVERAGARHLRKLRISGELRTIELRKKPVNGFISSRSR
jgi:hypothetical protein